MKPSYSFVKTLRTVHETGESVVIINIQSFHNYLVMENKNKSLTIGTFWTMHSLTGFANSICVTFPSGTTVHKIQNMRMSSPWRNRTRHWKRPASDEMNVIGRLITSLPEKILTTTNAYYLNNYKWLKYTGP